MKRAIVGRSRDEFDLKERRKEDKKFNEMRKEIKKIISEYDYVLEGPINLINVESGRKRRIF